MSKPVHLLNLPSSVFESGSPCFTIARKSATSKYDTKFIKRVMAALGPGVRLNVSLSGARSQSMPTVPVVNAPKNSPRLDDTDLSQSFWRKSINSNTPPKPVYGAKYAPLQQPITPSGSIGSMSGLSTIFGVGSSPKTKKLFKRGSKFDEYNKQTSDAWNEIDEPGSLKQDKPTTSSAHSPLGQKLSNGLEGTTVRSKFDLNQAQKARLEKFRQMVDQPTVDLEELRKHAWSGIPSELRSITWKLLTGYVPANRDRRQQTLRRKREEYQHFIEQYYDTRHEKRNQALYHQIHIDVPRTNPNVPIFQQDIVQNTLERILYIWAIRHPASGYVQGINDLVTPFYTVFLSDCVEGDPQTCNISHVPADALAEIEADSFWCVSKLLDGIQDNYIFPQPGIQKKVARLAELISRVDAPLHEHLAEQNVEFLQFSFRWMNCLLMREMPLDCIIRMWDTYQAEPDGFSELHLYVCASFLVHWSKELRALNDFQALIMMLQSLPTKHWGDKEVEILLAEAFMWRAMFQDSPRHFAN